MKVLWQAAAHLLAYPDERFWRRLPLIREAAAPYFAPFLDRVAKLGAGELAAHYVETFDLDRRCCLLVEPPLSSFPKDGTVITVRPPRTDPVEPWVAALNWPALAACVSKGDPRAYNAEGPYYGMYQFSVPMWKVVGGPGLPSDWPEEEQTYRAQLLYQHVAGRWQGQWPTCGARLFTRP
ncbi:transglycosylase family protein [Nonomuraea wenchangensis]|uniref:Transglycosylase-like domain-containing protein n=1 Tax=Nonomuraea wenchangensis TaxID=568860 RepID=A0A1I0KT10_9ACTN|nr:transglycosylase family protein [Nonomuraea wenchangensis]SEU28683.1 Transglycosylase-like domain-containing protein [Nonomuraea wenchangensis]